MDRVDIAGPRPVVMPRQSANIEDENRDLGFGSVIARHHALRLLNRDGSFNIATKGRGFWSSAGAYHVLLTLTWPRFFAVMMAAYLTFNCLFASLYVSLGPGTLHSFDHMSRFLTAFFFSVHTFATIGYGSIVPEGVGANMVVTAESLVGLLSLALMTGLVFARFSRPSAHIIYSRSAVIAPYRGIRGFEFRVLNGRRSQLIELHAMVVLSRFEDIAGTRQRQFYTLPLERDHVAFFPLTWTVVHPIDESSPLHGWTEEQLSAAEGEFLILITAFDETFSQTVHSRSSYAANEIVWNARFSSAFRVVPGGRFAVDLEKLHAVEQVSEEMTG
jgi:inward rectifier potassium channel